jgi:hypothetical protein
MAVRAGLLPLGAGATAVGRAAGMSGALGQQTGQRPAGLLQLAVLAAGGRVRHRPDPAAVDQEEAGAPARPQVVTVTIRAGG